MINPAELQIAKERLISICRIFDLEIKNVEICGDAVTWTIEKNYGESEGEPSSNEVVELELAK